MKLSLGGEFGVGESSETENQKLGFPRRSEMNSLCTSLIDSPLEVCALASPWQDSGLQAVHGTIYI